jgi:hypothetical protein
MTINIASFLDDWTLEDATNNVSERRQQTSQLRQSRISFFLGITVTKKKTPFYTS